MNFNYDNQPKEWNNKCPKCLSNIRWRLRTSRAGATSFASCSNNLLASREDIKSLRGMKVCFWKGIAVRQKDGGIRFKDSNNNWI